MSMRNRETVVAKQTWIPQPLTAEPGRPEHPVLARLPRVSGGVRRGNVVPGSVNASLYDAELLVELAMGRASEIEFEIEAELEAAREQGLAQGRQEADQQLAQRLHQIERDVSNFYRSTEDTVLELVIAVTRRLVGERLTLDSARDLTAEAIARHLDARPYAIHVSEGSRPLVEAALDDVRHRHPEAALPVVKIDPRLPQGRSVLLTQFGTVDLDIDSQIEAIRAGLA